VVPDEWRIADDHIHIPNCVAAQVEAIGKDKIPSSDPKLVEQFVRNAGVDALIDFDAENTVGWFASELMEPLAGGPKEYATAETRVQHPLVRRSDSPPDKEFSDLGVRVVGAHCFGVLVVLGPLDCLSHTLCHLKPWQGKLREVHLIQIDRFRAGLQCRRSSVCLSRSIRRRGDPAHHIFHLAGIAGASIVGLQNTVDILVSVERGVRQGGRYRADARGRG